MYRSDIQHIEITDILGSGNVDQNTPLLVLCDIPKNYLTIVNQQNNIYQVNIDKLNNNMEKRLSFIDKFIPIGMVQLDNNEKMFNMIFANTRLIPVTSTYLNVDLYKNDSPVWYGYIEKKGKINKSVGTIYSESLPKINIPVFPTSFLREIDYERDNIYYYKNIYSDPSYGKWILNAYKFNINRSQLKMIDSSGNLNNLFVPTTPKDIITDNNLGDFNRKIYFTTQGSIVSDTNCITPLDNLSKMTINQCNGSNNNLSIPLINANDESDLDLNMKTDQENIHFDHKKSSKKKSNWFKKGKTLVLKEKDEPWFLDSSIVGDAINVTDPHKVTGAIREQGTIDGDNDEISQPFVSPCKNNQSGYSRYDQNKNCNNIEGFTSETDNNDKTNLNNIIICLMVIIILGLIIIKKSK